jgi:hypothetical protein
MVATLIAAIVSSASLADGSQIGYTGTISGDGLHVIENYRLILKGRVPLDANVPYLPATGNNATALGGGKRLELPVQIPVTRTPAR